MQSLLGHIIFRLPRPIRNLALKLRPLRRLCWRWLQMWQYDFDCGHSFVLSRRFLPAPTVCYVCDPLAELSDYAAAGVPSKGLLN